MTKEKKEQVILFSTKEKWIIWVFGGLALLSPLLFKYSAFWAFFEIEKNPALIGDAIGGISAPFVGLLAAFLVYKSFEAQIKANASQLKLIKDSHDDQMKVISQEMKYNYITSLTKEVLETFDSLKLNYKGRDIVGYDLIKKIQFSCGRIIEFKNSKPKLVEIEKDTCLSILRVLSDFIKQLIIIKKEISESNLPNNVKELKRSIITNFVNDNIEVYIDNIKDIYYEKLPLDTKYLFKGFDNIRNDLKEA